MKLQARYFLWLLSKLNAFLKEKNVYFHSKNVLKDVFVGKSIDYSILAVT